MSVKMEGTVHEWEEQNALMNYPIAKQQAISHHKNLCPFLFKHKVLALICEISGKVSKVCAPPLVHYLPTRI